MGKSKKSQKHLSSCKSKKDYIKHIRRMVKGQNPEFKQFSLQKDITQEEQNEAFNRKISAQIDQELKDYVKQFRAKVTKNLKKGRKKIQKIQNEQHLHIPESKCERFGVGRRIGEEFLFREFEGRDLLRFVKSERETRFGRNGPIGRACLGNEGNGERRAVLPFRVFIR
jgi:seryl-tRNA synthetase